MCGFAGFISANLDASVAVLKQMGDAIAHRGPDDSGIWQHPQNGLGLVHRRLAILDLSAAGHQPIVSFGNRFTIVFNGEIYNHLQLRDELEKIVPQSWRGHSDTETLLAGFEQWGITETLKRSVGMFAMAVWDEQKQTLILTRDRLGEKPLYYGFQNEHFLFGSELKALCQHPAFAARLNRSALLEYFRHNYIPAPLSIYQGISKLMPGQMLSLEMGTANPEISRYWSLLDVAEQGAKNPWQGSAH